jgi:hypothetical protein
MSPRQFSNLARKREKQASRERDCARLREGMISAEQLARKNGLFSALDRSQAKIVRRRVVLALA